MKQGRKTTEEEKLAIVRYCLENGSNYGETAIKYSVSYQQVYTWVKKFKQLGEPAWKTDAENVLQSKCRAQNLKKLESKLRNWSMSSTWQRWGVTC